jgi:hypothetical protein
MLGSECLSRQIQWLAGFRDKRYLVEPDLNGRATAPIGGSPLGP